jgi:hypothetical protein
MLLDRVAHGEDEDVARAAGLGNDVGDLGLLERGFAGAQAPGDLDPTARAHAPRHRDGRQHDALVGMAVRADVVLAHGLGEEQAEPVRRQFAASAEACRIHVEGAGGAPHRHQADIVLDRAHPADPRPQGLHRFVHPSRHVSRSLACCRENRTTGDASPTKKGPLSRALP